MPTAIKKDFHVKKGVEAPSLKIGTQEVTSLLDSSSTSAVIREPAVAKQILNNGGATTKIYDSADLLPSADNNSGDFAYIYSTNRLYLWNGSGWYNIAIVNTAPGISGADSSYSLTSALNVDTISALQVTLVATDPEGLPITFSAVGSDSASSFVDITQDSSVTTITPKNRTALASGDSAGGNFSITFKATDGTFIAPFVSSFTLQFPESFAMFALSEIQKLQSNDIAAGDEFGQDVALSDQANYAIVGAWKEDEKASDAGAAYIFARSGNSLVQQAKLMAGDGTSSDSFGYSVDINKTGTYAVVGAKAADPSSGGAAYIYKRTGTSWSEISKINNTSSPSSGDWYGVSVAISNSGDRVVVGSHNRSSGTGAAYVYKEGTGTHDVTSVGGNFISISNSLSSQNSSPRAFAFNANGTKMFMLGSGTGTPGVYQYSLSTAYDTSTWTYDNVNFAVYNTSTSNGQVSAPADIHFNTDGTKMFISGQHNGTGYPSKVWQYNLSTGFDLSTASYSNVSLDITSRDNLLHGITMNPAGTKLVLAGDQNNKVYGYDLSTAFDLSTATYAEEFAVGSQEATPQDVIFNGDGTKMFVCGTGTDDVHIYNLSTAYDVSSSTFSQTINYGNSYSYGGVGSISGLTGMNFNPDGSKFYLSCVGLDRIIQFSALEQYSLEQELVRSPSSTSHYYGYSVDIDDDGDTVVVGSYGNSKAYVWTRSGTTWTQQVQLAGSQATSASEWFGRSVSISEDGLTVLVGAEREAHSGTTRPGAGYIFKYGTANYQVANATHDHSSPAISQDTQPSACLFNGDGTKVFVFGYQNDKIYQYNLSTAYDVSSSSMSYASGSDITLSDFSGDPSGARWNNDGTKLFIIDKTNDQLHQYTLSTAYDLSTLSYNGYHQVGEATVAFGFDFNSDGTKVFIVDRSGDRVYQYSMSTAYDYSTMTYDSVYASTTDGNTDPFGIAFNSTGTRYFVTDDDSTASIHIYECANPYDLSDVEHIGTFAVNSQELYPKQITFSPSGDKMFLVGNDSDKIQRYDVQTTNSWYQEARLQQSDAGYQDWMGSKASISGDGTAAVLGSSYAQRPGIGDGYGEMRIFTRSTTGVWSEAGLRQASDWEYMDRFGLGVDISPDGRYVLVGAPNEDTNGSDAGKAYFYKAPQNQFTFPWQTASGSETKIEGTTASEYFGYSVALDQYANRAAIGAQYANFGGQSYTGAGYIYGRSGSAWSQQARLGPSDGVNGDRFGTGVALSLDGNTAAFGAYLEDPESRSDAGSVYVYDGSVTASFNIGAASYTQSTPALNSQTTYPRGIVFNSDGTKMFVLTSQDNGKLIRYSLSTAYDISTASHDGSSNDKYINQAQSGSGNVAGINNPGEIRVKSDGTKMWISDQSDNKIYQIALSSAWDFNGALWNQGFFDPNAQTSTIDGFDFSPDGTKLIIASISGSSGTKAWEYTVTPGNALSSSNVTYANRSVNLYSQSPVISEPRTICWHGDGNAFFVGCSSNDKIFKFDLNNSNFELSGATLSGTSLDISSYETSIQFMTFDKTLHVPNSTGAKMYIMGGGMTDDKIHEYATRGPVWSQVAKTFGGTASSQHFGQSIDLNSDGTIMAVGAPNEGYETTNAGAVYVMKKQINYQVMDMTHLNFTTVNSDNNETNDMAFNSNGTKLYHVGTNTNKVVEYDLSTAYDVSTLTYNSVNFLPSAGGYNTGIRWKPDGTKIFVLSHTNNGGGTATVHRYDVSTAFDLSTVNATAEQTYDARNYLNRAWGFTFKPDGTKMFISDDNGNDINEFSLSTAWDLTTASYVTAFTISSQDGQPSGLEFNNDGKILYMAGFGNDRIYKYNLSTAYDISTMGYSSEYISVSGQTTQPGGIKFHPDGSKLFMACIASNGVDTYDTSGVSYENVSKPSRSALHSNGQNTQSYSYMGWDVAMNSSATRMIAGAYKDTQSTSNAGAAYIFTGDGTGSFTAEVKLRPPTSPSPSGAQFGHSVDITEDGNTVVIGSKMDPEKGTQMGSATIYNRLPPEYYAVEDFTHLGFYSLTDGGVSSITDIAWNNDGTKFFSIAYSGDKVNEYSVATAYDVSTKTYVRQFDLSSQTNYPTAITFNNDGTKMFIGHPTSIGGSPDGSDNGLFQYNLTTGFDLSTASYSNIGLSNSVTSNRTWGVSFKPDGTKMFISADTGDDIRQFTLSTPFDLSTISSYDSSTDLYVGSQDSNIRGHAFNGDGTKLYVVGDNDRIYIYNLSTAYDVSTGSYDTYKTLSNQTNNPSGIKFNPDGSKMYISCIQSHGVDQYSVIKQDWDSGYKIFHPDPTSTDYFGVSVSISGDGKTVSVGCERDDTKASNAGAVLVYHKGEEGPTNNGTGSNYLNGNGTSVSYHHVKTITASDGIANDYLSAGQDRAQALEMSKNGEYIIAGTYRADPNSLTDAGKTYIFKNT